MGNFFELIIDVIQPGNQKKKTQKINKMEFPFLDNSIQILF